VRRYPTTPQRKISCTTNACSNASTPTYPTAPDLSDTAPMTFGAIMTWILWRFRPALWLDGVVARLIGWALALLEDEDHREWLKTSPAHCAWFGGWLGLGEARLDELIHYRACELLNLGCQGRKPPSFLPARGVRTLDQAIGRFARLTERYCAIERLAQLRAIKLGQMLEDADPLGRADLRPSPPPPPPLVVVLVVVATFSSPTGFSAQRIRAPPYRRTPENQARPTR
jgi:hypothetical protein